MRVGLLAYLAHTGSDYRAAGVSVYSRQLLTHLPRAAPEIEYVAFAGRDAPAFEGIETVLTPVPSYHPAVRIGWEQTGFLWQARSAGVDLVHGLVNVVPWVRFGPSVVTVHDLAFLHHPERFRRERVAYLRAAVALSVRRARRIIAVSRSTQEDLVSSLGVAPERIHVVYSGIDPGFRPLSEPRDRVIDEVTGGKPFILFVGTLEPRKNLDVLIRAYAGARSAAGLPHDLVLAGARGWMYEPLFALVRSLGLEDRVRFIDYVDPADLPRWYNSADLFAYPSAYEGFGLPVLEAMACGVPVVTSTTPSLLEAASGAAATAETGSVEALQMEIIRVLSSRDVTENLRRQGLIRAQEFTWQRTAQATARVYREVLDACD